MDGYKYKKNDKGVFLPIIDDVNTQFGATNGLVQRSVCRLVEELQPLKKRKTVSMNISFLQIYNEKIYDLLNPSMFKKIKGDQLIQPAFHHTNSQNGNADPTGLKLKWNPFDVYTVENLFNFTCTTSDEILRLFHYGLRNKVIGSHKMNLTSSRSHTIFCVTVEQIDPLHPDNMVISKLQLVDLAGSERQELTKVNGKTQKESIEINKSLFTLRQVITALNDLAGNKKDTSGIYVPYRDSKLTCLLRQSIGGNAFCCMIACLHPSDLFFSENYSTLQYAGMAGAISNRPVKNDDPKTKQIEELKGQVKMLTNELMKANQHIEFLSNLTG
eukprot:CAMPEP_0170503100 /NCGR_PEP_ID=MMETSP0208-20121228/43631_1 /TAXON_ID=197538 /ORGANISM="Strombidium inclinatum, Strain S3" /LENGTH=328 /DNA_ID=CAMNT_0010782557 /DNA_START=441 /DNA_END=1427 /DNA_ORIENTATION=+